MREKGRGEKKEREIRRTWKKSQCPTIGVGRTVKKFTTGAGAIA